MPKRKPTLTSTDMDAFIEELELEMRKKTSETELSESSGQFKQRAKRKKKTKVEAPLAPPLKPSQYIKSHVKRSHYGKDKDEDDDNDGEDNTPDVLPFSDLIRSHPDIFASDEDLDAGSRKQRTQANLVDELKRLKAQAEDENANPYAHRLFRDLLAHMPLPSYRMGQMPHKEILKSLKNKRYVVPLFTVAYEKRLLKQAGRFYCATTGKTVDYPACKHGDQCVMVTTDFEGSTPESKVPYTAIMYPDELKNCEETGNGPLDRRECIQCHRFYIQKWVMRSWVHDGHVTTDPELCFALYYNECDCDGGYARAYVTVANPEKWMGFFDPVAQVRRHAQRVYKEPGTGRWCLDCTAMEWHPPSRIAPRIGEPHSDFRTRSAEYYEARTGVCEEARAHRIHTTTPCASALRDLRAISVAQLRDYETKLTEAYHHPPLPDPEMYSVTISLDALQPALQALSSTSGPTDVITTPPSIDSVVCQHTLPDLVYHLVRSSTWAVTNNDDSPLLKLFSKLWPQRCKTRKFSEGLTKGLDSDSEFRETVLDLLLCSLLGNYEHTVHSSRPHSTKIRHLLYSARRTDPSGFLAAFNDIRYAHTFLLRDWLVYAVNDAPALASLLRSLFPWDVFCTNVQHTTHSIRRVVCRAMRKGHLWPGPGFNPGDIKELRRICDQGHASMQSVSFPRPRAPLSQRLHLMVSALNRFHKITPPSVSSRHHAALSDLVARLDRRIHDPLDILLPALPAFGVPDTAVQRTKSLLTLSKGRHSSAAVQLEQLRRLAVAFPYTFAILTMGCRLYKDACDMMMRPLPHHYREAQINALTKHSGGVIPLEKGVFYVCTKCGVKRFKSAVISFFSPCRHRSEWCVPCHRPITIGYTFCVSDLFTDKVYCKFDHPPGQASRKRRRDPSEVSLPYVNGVRLDELIPTEIAATSSKGTTHQEATCVSLIGQALYIDKTVVIMCPRCASFMEYDEERCLHTSQGAICARCTTQEHQALQKRFRTSVERPDKIFCVRCTRRPKPIPLSADFHWFPCGVYVCTRHYKEQYAVAVSRITGQLTKQRVIDAILRIQRELDGLQDDLFNNKRQKRQLYMRQQQLRSQRR